MVLRSKGTKGLKALLATLLMPGAILAQVVVIEPHTEGEDSSQYREISGAWTNADAVSAADGVSAKASRSLESPEEAGPSVMEFRPSPELGEEIMVSVTTPVSANATGLSVELVGADPPQIRPLMLTELSADKWFDVGLFTVPEGETPVFQIKTTDALQPVLADRDFEVSISAVQFRAASDTTEGATSVSGSMDSPFADAEGNPVAVTVEDPFGSSSDAPFSSTPAASSSQMAVPDPFADSAADSSPFSEVPSAVSTTNSPFQDETGEPVPVPSAPANNPFGDVAQATPDQSNPFGSSTAQAQAPDPFGGTSESNPFGTNTATSGDVDPFADTPNVELAAAAPSTGSNPFGSSTSAPSANADPFGSTSTQVDGDNPFGTSTSTPEASSNPFSDTPANTPSPVAASPFSDSPAPNAPSPFSSSPTESTPPSPFGGPAPSAPQGNPFGDAPGNPFGGQPAPSSDATGNPFGSGPGAPADPFGGTSTPGSAANPFGDVGTPPDAGSPFADDPSDSSEMAMSSPFGDAPGESASPFAGERPSPSAAAGSTNLPPSPFSDSVDTSTSQERHLATQLIQSQSGNFAATGRSNTGGALFQEDEKVAAPQEVQQTATAIKWVPSPREAQQQALETGKPVLVLFLGEDDNSKMFEQDVLSKADISKTINQFVAVRIPYVGDDPLVKKYAVRSAPYAVVLNKHGFTRGHVNLTQPDYRILRDLQKHLK